MFSPPGSERVLPNLFKEISFKPTAITVGAIAALSGGLYSWYYYDAPSLLYDNSVAKWLVPSLWQECKISKWKTSSGTQAHLIFLTGRIDTKFADTFTARVSALPIGDPIDLVIDTHGGEVCETYRVVYILSKWQGKVRAFIPRRACSGGTAIALCAGTIYMDPFAYISPYDTLMPQRPSYIPALDMTEEHSTQNKDMYWVFSNASRAQKTFEVLNKTIHKASGRTEAAQEELSKQMNTDWEHSRPFFPEDCRKFGLPIEEPCPPAVGEILKTMVN